MTDRLAALGGSPHHLDDLRERLAARAAADGLLDVAYRTLDSPVGPLLLAATPAGVVRVAFEGVRAAGSAAGATHAGDAPGGGGATGAGGHTSVGNGADPAAAEHATDGADAVIEDPDAVLADLAARIGGRILRAPRALDPAARELEEYFAGRRRRFEVPVDLRLATGFRRSVLDHLRDIDYGATATYAQVASASGSPRAVRAVGTACALNPVPLFVPCHRVVRSDGTPGNYRGGPAAKAALLALEHAARERGDLPRAAAGTTPPPPPPTRRRTPPHPSSNPSGDTP